MNLEFNEKYLTHEKLSDGWYTELYNSADDNGENGVIVAYSKRRCIDYEETEDTYFVLVGEVDVAELVFKYDLKFEDITDDLIKEVHDEAVKRWNTARGN